MRILIILLLSALMEPHLAVPVHAAPPAQTMESAAEETVSGATAEVEDVESEEAETAAESREDKVSEEDADVEKENSSPHRNPIRQDALTEEQAEEGWKLVGGYAFPPEALEGDAGIALGGTGSFSNETALSNVTIDLEIPVGQTEPFTLFFMNTDTLQEYYVTLYASNDYQDIFKLPAGAYYFTGGGPENDYMSLYTVASPEAFVVEPGVDLYLRPVVTSRGAFASSDTNDGSEETQEEIAETDPVTEEPEEQEDHVHLAYYLAGAAILICIGVLLSVAALKYDKARKERM